MNKIKGIFYAALSSASFGLSPFFSITLLLAGFSTFEVLFYRWGVATAVLVVLGLLSGCNFRLSRKDLIAVSGLGLLRAITSFSLIIAYKNIASGVASTIHFMYPLAVSLTMMFVFKEKKSLVVLSAIAISLIGVSLLSTGDLAAMSDDVTSGLIAAAVSVFSYAGYIVGVRKTRAANINSTALTCYVMCFGTLLYLIGSCFMTGIRIVTDSYLWLIILGLALPATALSNITLVKAIKYAGPTLTSILGALEPLTAVVIGVLIFNETFTLNSTIGIVAILVAVALVLYRKQD